MCTWHHRLRNSLQSDPLTWRHRLSSTWMLRKRRKKHQRLENAVVQLTEIEATKAVIMCLRPNVVSFNATFVVIDSDNPVSKMLVKSYSTMQFSTQARERERERGETWAREADSLTRKSVLRAKEHKFTLHEALIAESCGSDVEFLIYSLWLPLCPWLSSGKLRGQQPCGHVSLQKCDKTTQLST